MAFWKRLFRKESRTQAYIYNDGITGAVAPVMDFQKLAAEAYQQNLIAFRCINIIASAAGAIPWQQYRQGAEGEAPEVVEEGDIYNLLYRPNPGEGWSSLIQSIVSYYLLNGNAYVERVGLKTGGNAGIPKELYSLRPDRMKIVKGLRGPTGYEYGDGARKVVFEINPAGQSDILHLKTFNPLDDYYGWAATMSAAGHIDNYNDGLSWNRGMMKNGARPGTLVTMERSMTQEQYDRFKESMESNYAGPKNAGKILLMDDLGEGKVGIQPWGWNPKELDFLESSREDARRIAFAYGVPAQLLGIPGDTTYANFQEARAVLWEDTIVPLLSWLRDELNNWLYPVGSTLWIDFDLNNVPALEIRREAKWKRVQDSDFLTINEKREAHGYEPIEGGDTIFMPMSMTPALGDVPEVEEEPEINPPLTEEVVEEEEEEARNRLLETGIPQEMLDAYVGLKEEWE